ncbi:hypothetical protein GRI89_12620 [Altererythrobacter salegens]|uniref:Tetratricopeptide repeat protein n=1 Tax=Croceibacterium salegens TaxID=1737568 RepID=A0A6I4SWK0_9SPHN|nr:hypothetical protein [Croceibacterium salegens]MXO60381.1 hypothetical protein [Croceibacterium salegens]
MKSVSRSLFAVLAAWPVSAQSQEADSSLKFEVSCSAPAQAEFNRGVELLHSFEYPATTRLFAEMMAQYPDCAMARWGAAMSIWHPLWAPPSAAQLEDGMNILAEADLSGSTAREQSYFNALRQFFSSNDPQTHDARALAYEEAMAEVYVANLDDPEAATFYALALLATADPRDKSYANQFHAAGLLNWVGESLPEHPGMLHYTIHAYDLPGMAHLALPAALVYADSAPDSAHAQHMPSHIFTRLGMWDQSLASNHDSTRSAAEFTESANLPGHYDEGLHSMDYLMYAMMQSARDDEAAQLLEQLAGIGATSPENFKVAFTFAALPARYAIERRAWDEAEQLELGHPEFPWSEYPWAQAIHHFARGLGAARNGNLDHARQSLTELQQLQCALGPTALPYWREEVQVQIDALSAWIAWDEGDGREAQTLARAAADREDAVDKHPVTPGEVVPARELYAEMLLLSGDHHEALVQFEEVLSGSPNRLNALLGARNAAEGSGLAELAENYRDIANIQTEGRAPARNW